MSFTDACETGKKRGGTGKEGKESVEKKGQGRREKEKYVNDN